jgi:hypothetical protein
MANLRHHAIRCFGEDAVKNATNPQDIESQNGSIFASFARQGQESVQYTHRSHSNPEIRYGTSSTSPKDILMYFTSARVVKWVTENNRPANIVNDPELRNLLSAGRPHISIPSPSTVSRDINASFVKCRERVSKLLRVSWFMRTSYKCDCTHVNYYQEYGGRLHFATDAWTSPNHRAFVAWTVHLQHEGEMLAFLLDIIEVPEVSVSSCMLHFF